MSLIQYRYFLFTLLLLNSPFAFSQKHKEPTLSQKKGLIIFEGNKDLYDIYFIKTDKHNLASLFSFSDTIYASTIQPPFEGHVPMASDDFKKSLESQKSFDFFPVLIYQKNYQDQPYEDSTYLNYRYGYIKYIKSESYKLPKPWYKEIHYQGKTIMIVVNERIPVEIFRQPK